VTLIAYTINIILFKFYFPKVISKVLKINILCIEYNEQTFVNFILAKRLTIKQKGEIIQSFIKGKTIDDLSKIHKCTNLTISRNLKKTLGDQKYKEIIEKNKDFKKKFKNDHNLSVNCQENILKKNISTNAISPLSILAEVPNEDNISTSSFFEIPPLDYEIDNLQQKDLSSIPLSEVNFPDILYMIVDKNIELEVKYLKDYPGWQFLSENELKRKTIEIFLDMKSAKRICNKEQKVIKVPNTNVFKIVSSRLISRGITRIVNADQLISLE
tara:strand:+ start:49 stop:861 length:813 start_codon:yes stop_codon:yes gene_type:complete